MAPTCRVTSRPSLNKAIVGIALMRKRRARFCAFSVLTFATTHFPAPSSATLFSSGATILHGPHHGAQKSTNTGRAERVVKASKARSLATSIGSLGALSSVPHFPQRPVPPSLSYFRRLRWPHFGQVTKTPRSSSCVEFIFKLYRRNLPRLVAACMEKDSATNIEPRTTNIEFQK